MSQKVLFLCISNVARIQMAEGYYNHFAGGEYASSAAFEFDETRRYPYLPQKQASLRIQAASNAYQMVHKKTCRKKSTNLALI